MEYISLDGAINEVKTWIDFDNFINRKYLILEGLMALPSIDIIEAEVTEIDIDGYIYSGCSNCRKTIKDYFSYCPYCGAKLK